MHRSFHPIMKRLLFAVSLILSLPWSATAWSAIASRQGSVADANAGSITVSVPAGTQNGDFEIALIAGASSFGVWGGTGSGPAGWIRQLSQINSLGYVEVYSHVASSEAGTYTFNAPGGSSLPSMAVTVIPFFDDGGATVAYDTGATATAGDSSYPCPAITLANSADPYELVVCEWVDVAGSSALQMPAIGSVLWFDGISSGAVAYPSARNAATPTPTAGTAGAAAAAIAQFALKVTAASSQRIMLRGVQNSLASGALVPTNVVNGDLMFASDRSSAPLTPAGWTQKAITGDGLYAFYTHTALSEPASYVFSITNGNVGMSAWFHMDGSAITLDTQAVAGPSGSGTSYTGPTLVTAAANEIVLAEENDADGTSSHPITGPSGALDATQTDFRPAAGSTRSGIMPSYLKQAAAGASTAKSASEPVATTWYALQFAIKPPAAGGQGGWVFLP